MGASEVTKQLTQRINSIHSQILNLRAIERYLETDLFHEVYYSVKASVREELETILESNNLDALKNWTVQNRKRSLEALSYRELRQLAKNYNIYLWSRLSKDELLEALHAFCVQPSGKPAETSIAILETSKSS